MTPRLYRAGPLVAAFAGNDAARTSEFHPPSIPPRAGLTATATIEAAPGELVAGETAVVSTPAAVRAQRRVNEMMGRGENRRAICPAADTALFDTLNGVPKVDIPGNLQAAISAGRRMTSILREVVSLRRGAGKLTPNEYFYYRLWDSALSAAEKRRFVGKQHST